MAGTAATPAEAAPTLPRPEDHVIVMFGATGDLAKRKLLPGFFNLAEAGLMPEHFRIVGTARHAVSDEEFRALARSAIEEFGRASAPPASVERFVAALTFAPSGDSLDPLRDAVAEARDQIGGDPRVLHYLSVPPSATAAIVEQLGALGLQERARLIIEKPFGTDLASARALNASLRAVFDESQIFRIDHYLGREAVLNLLAVRFANGMFEPIWNRDHIDHIQIDVPETLSVGTRGSFYEQTGAFRDMLVTHLFQVLSFVAMEPPTALAPKPLVAEKTKVFDSMPPLDPADVVRGQYEGYRDEDGVAPDSDTETFVAVRAFVDNWRWAGVPFFLRTGKRMAERRHLLTVVLKQPPRRMFPIDIRYAAESFGNDHLSFELDDPGDISTSFLAKVPGPSLRLGEAYMNFRYDDAFGGSDQAFGAYERLLHDVMMGDHTLFTTADGIERVWEVSAPALEHPSPLHPYKPGTWGPAASDELIAPRRWHLPGHPA
jgi:glucose-6-phosphate 1-dehydrogenase